MNTFFPSIQLFFESGLSCSVEGAELQGDIVGLDPALRFRLTDITHEEQGFLTRTILPEKLVPKPSILVVEAAVARRTSVALKQKTAEGPSLYPPGTTIAQEDHVVAGLRLEGMKQMQYVWAKSAAPTVGTDSRTWSHVRITGLRDDVPVPFVGFPQQRMKPGERVRVVTKGSVISTS